MPTPEEILEQQKNNWDTFSPGWKKWDAFNMKFLSPMGEKIIAALDVKPTDRILDVATGTGEPGLTLATLATQGHVVGQDISQGMLTVAAENAAARGIKNYEVKFSNAGSLPFVDESFDAVSCRMGFMFFPEMQEAANEMARVLKRGGRIATSVWAAPAKNFWIGGLMSVINKYVEMPTPPPGSPGMFRCAAPGLMADMFRKAGVKNVVETEVSGEVDYGSFSNYWEMMTEVAAPVVAAMNKSDESVRRKIRDEVETLLRDTHMKLSFASIIISGEKG